MFVIDWIAKNIKGDKTLWALIVIFAFISSLAVYSTSSNLEYVVRTGTTTAGYFFKHFLFVGLGIFTAFMVHKIPYRFFRPASRLGLLLAIGLLLMAIFTGTTIKEANASRWINVLGFSFQPSAFALIVLMVYVASYLAKNHDKKITFKDSLFPLWTPVVAITALVVFANLSTALIIVFSVVLLAFLGGYPFKYLLYIAGIGIALGGLLFLFAKAFPDLAPSRFSTWESRIDSYFAQDENKKEVYQVELSKMAIAKGGIVGQGPGKSTMKNFLPQSSSDFIYAIITEEYGSMGALFIMALYFILLFRLVVISQQAATLFGQLLALGLGIPIMLQAIINMAVAVELMPVTGQNLPLISSGGTSIWMTCLALGCILSVSARKRKDGKMEKDKPEADVEEELAENIIKITKDEKQKTK